MDIKTSPPRPFLAKRCLMAARLKEKPRPTKMTLKETKRPKGCQKRLFGYIRGYYNLSITIFQLQSFYYNPPVSSIAVFISNRELHSNFMLNMVYINYLQLSSAIHCKDTIARFIHNKCHSKKNHGQAHPMLVSLLKKLHNDMISNFVMKYWLPKVSGGGVRVPLQMFIFVKTIVHLFNGPCFTKLAFSNWFVEVVG